MGRRSAGNPRYRKDANIGRTRRSAASAKPKRDAGEAPSKRGSSAGKGSGKSDRRTVMPDTAEYKLLRKIWFALLMVAIVASVGGYFLREYRILGTVALVIAYTALFAAFGLDLLKIKKLRREWYEQKTGGKRTDKVVADGASKDAPVVETAAETDSSDEGKAD